MHYTIVVEPTEEPDHPGWYYAHIPSLDLTTHGLGIEGACEAAKDLAQAWIAELKAAGKPVPTPGPAFVSQVEVIEHAVH